jgi:hypothetical protein
MTAPHRSVLQHILDDIAHQHIADNVNLWPRLQSQVRPQIVPHHSLRLAWTIALVLTALLTLTTVAYALYRAMADPGLQAVNDAGLVTDLKHTASSIPIKPTAVNTASTPTRSASAAPAVSALTAQQIGRVTVTLNWAYADESRVAIGLTVRGLHPPVGVKPNYLINPIVFGDDHGTLFGLDGTSQATELRPAEPGTVDVTAISYQPLTANQPLHLTIDVKLGDTSVPVMLPDATPRPGPVPLVTVAPLGDFQFQIDLPVYEGTLIRADQSVSANGVTISLQDIHLTPSYAEARLCYQLPDPSDWQIESHLQIGAAPTISQTAVRLTTDKADLNNARDQRCVLIDYPASYLNTTGPLTLTVEALHTSLPEVIPAEAVARANAALAVRGIEFEYSVLDHGARLIVTRKPAALSDVEANQLAFQALEQAAEERLVGPWTFSVTMAEPPK